MSSHRDGTVFRFVKPERRTFKPENGALATGPAVYPQPTSITRVRDGYLEIRTSHVKD